MIDPQRPIRTLAIRTDFAHHGPNAGYKQILKFTRPTYVIGFDETGPLPSKLLRTYQFLYEFIGYWKFRKKVDLVHVLYGEDYFRFSSFLFRKPVVVTYHQPADSIDREVSTGDIKGRVGALTHKMTKGRFRKAAAFIVTESGQKEALKKVVPEEKIHVIPLGTHIGHLLKFSEANSDLKRTDEVRFLTVGNWLRDWDFYFDFVKLCQTERPDWKFVLVNRRLEVKFKAQVKDHPNLTYLTEVGDEDLYRQYATATAQFLPLTGIAGNNSVIESIALGCPIVMTNLVNSDYPIKGDYLKLYPKGDKDAALTLLDKFAAMDDQARATLRKDAVANAREFDWEIIGKKTLDIYRSVL